MRQRATLPSFVQFRTDENDNSCMAFLCICGEAMAKAVYVHVDEGGSSAEVRCPKCHRYIQIRASMEV